MLNFQSCELLSLNPVNLQIPKLEISLHLPDITLQLQTSPQSTNPTIHHLRYVKFPKWVPRPTEPHRVVGNSGSANSVAQAHLAAQEPPRNWARPVARVGVVHDSGNQTRIPDQLVDVKVAFLAWKGSYPTFLPISVK